MQLEKILLEVLEQKKQELSHQLDEVKNQITVIKTSKIIFSPITNQNVKKEEVKKRSRTKNPKEKITKAITRRGISRKKLIEKSKIPARTVAKVTKELIEGGEIRVEKINGRAFYLKK